MHSYGVPSFSGASPDNSRKMKFVSDRGEVYRFINACGGKAAEIYLQRRICRDIFAEEGDAEKDLQNEIHTIRSAAKLFTAIIDTRINEEL